VTFLLATWVVPTVIESPLPSGICERVFANSLRASRTFESKVGSRRIGGREMKDVSANPHQLVVVQGKRHDETSAVITEQLTDAGTRHVVDICQIAIGRQTETR